MSILSQLRLTVFPNGIASFLVDSNAEAKEENYTVIINDDSGKTFVSHIPGMTYTLPAMAIGNTITFVNMAVDGSASLAISPNAANGITYVGSSVADKDLINLKATAKKGDFVTLASLNGTTTWQVVSSRGIWDKEA